jgi:hypothetical protein
MMLSQYLHRGGVEGDSPEPMGLGVLLGGADVAAADLQRAGLEVDVSPAESKQLGAAEAGDHHEPDEGAPGLVLLPRGGRDAAGLLDGRWARLWRGLPRRPRDVGGVGLDPLPPDGGGEGAAEHVVDLHDGGLGEGLALVRAALQHRATGGDAVVLGIAAGGTATRWTFMAHLTALVWAVDAMLHERRHVAASATAA